MGKALASVFTAVALLAIVGSTMTAARDRESERVAPEGAGLIHAADDRPTGSVLASVNRNPGVAPDEAVSALMKGEDPESLRWELIGCLLAMLIVTVGALLAICYFDQTTGGLRERRARPTTLGGESVTRKRGLCEPTGTDRTRKRAAVAPRP